MLKKGTLFSRYCLVENYNTNSWEQKVERNYLKGNRYGIHETGVYKPPNSFTIPKPEVFETRSWSPLSEAAKSRFTHLMSRVYLWDKSSDFRNCFWRVVISRWSPSRLPRPRPLPRKASALTTPPGGWLPSPLARGCLVVGATTAL